VVEHCQNCQSHGFNTRHDPAKYLEHANGVAAAIKAQIPNAEIVFNKVTKQHSQSDIYSQLIFNDDQNLPYFDILPRIGALEVSINGVLLFSKVVSGKWPHYNAVANRAKSAAEMIDGDQNLQTMATPQQVSSKY